MINSKTHDYFQKTYNEAKNISDDDVFLEIYDKLRPGEPATIKAGQQILYSKFFDPKRYNLGTLAVIK